MSALARSRSLVKYIDYLAQYIHSVSFSWSRRKLRCHRIDPHHILDFCTWIVLVSLSQTCPCRLSPREICSSCFHRLLGCRSRCRCTITIRLQTQSTASTSKSRVMCPWHSSYLYCLTPSYSLRSVIKFLCSIALRSQRTGWLFVVARLFLILPTRSYGVDSNIICAFFVSPNMIQVLRLTAQDDNRRQRHALDLSYTTQCSCSFAIIALDSRSGAYERDGMSCLSESQVRGIAENRSWNLDHDSI